ncbi:MAG: N-acyl-D-amino-acid deacylase family protein, partial [Acidobacteriota bacterium]
MAIDLLISNGTIIDGTGQPGYRGDVAIAGDRIVALGEIDAAANQQIDATGLTIIPGLIDPHSHADLIFTLPAPRQAELLAGKVFQGITTTLVGNCGLGVAPFTKPTTRQILREINGWMSPAESPDPWPWQSAADYLDFISGQGPLLNVGTLVPHGPLRIEAMGLAKGAPSTAQQRRMKRALERALRDGGFGLSTGLIYPPGMYSAPDELTELARVVAAHDRIYTSHIRGSSETLLPAVAELIEIGRQTGARVHHSHNEAVGRAHWSKIDQVLALEEA